MLKHNESTASKLQITAYFPRRLRLSSSLSFEFALISEISFHFSSSEVDAKMNSRELLFWSIKEPVDDVIYNHNNDEDSEMRKRTQVERFFIFHEEVGRKARIEIFAVQKKILLVQVLIFPWTIAPAFDVRTRTKETNPLVSPASIDGIGSIVRTEL